jgi:hypothetical protein
LKNKCRKSKRCTKCDNEKFLIDSVREIIKKIYKKKDDIENIFKKKFSDYFHKDFINIIISGLHRIINDDDLYILRFGGRVQNYRYTELEYVDYYEKDFDYQIQKYEDRKNSGYYHRLELYNINKE